MTTRQFGIVVPQEQELFYVEVPTGIYAGVWGVDRQLARTPSGIFLPYNERLTRIQTYDALQNDPALLEAGFGLVPASVLLYGIQHDTNFYKMLIGTSQLTGSGVVEEDGRYHLGTPNVTRGEDLQYQGLRNDRPIARIEPQSGQVRRLDKTTLWGIGEDSKVEFEKLKHPTFMHNADGNRFVGLVVRSGGDVDAYAGRLPLVGDFDRGARLAKRVE